MLTGIFVAARALEDAYRHLLARGTSMGLEDRLMSFHEFTSLLGLQEKYALDEKFRAG